MKFLKKWFKAFDELLKIKKSVLKLLFAFLFVGFLFIAPYLIILFNAIAIYNNHSAIVISLIVLLPFYFQLCIGLIAKYFYELMEANLEQIELTKKEAFLGGLAFFPTIIISIALAILLLVL